MGLFSRSSSDRRAPLSTATPEDLRRLGEMAFGGESVYPPGISGIPTAELDKYALAFMTAAGFPASGSPEERAANGRFLDELTATAELAEERGFVGAMCVALNSVVPTYQRDARFQTILGRALEALRLDGVSYTAIPPVAMDWWTSVHGYGEIHPAGWPSALADLPAPSGDATPDVEDLAPGEVRRLAQAPANPANAIFAERRPDGSIQAVVEGPDPETGVPRRWNWEGLSAADYPSFLRKLGDRLVTHSYWAHDDLTPYFPCRTRSRDELRSEASAQVLTHKTRG